MSRQAPIHLALVWRLHQPWTVSPSLGRPLLPWVRLHASSTYTDLCALLRAHPTVRSTVALSPSLLDQLELAQKGVRDLAWELTATPAEALTPRQREQVVRHFFSVHWDRLLLPVPRYRELLKKRGLDVPREGWAEAASRFDVDDLRDLQLLFNLAWLGFTARADPAIQDLIRRERGFSEEDKALVLDKQSQLMQKLFRGWRQLRDGGMVEVLPCPYYYPLLPLLIDSGVAKRCNPEVQLPRRFTYPEDARRQIRRARERITLVAGREPEGLWPSELALSRETVTLASEEGFRYLITAADLLFHSLDERGSALGKRRLFQPYRVDGCTVFFQHTALSWRLASEYARWEDSEAAVDDFLGHLCADAATARVEGNAPPLVVVALPSEQPWEAYPARGQTFLWTLMSRLAERPDIRTVTLGEHLAEHPPVLGLDHLHSGSWVEGNFAMWIGEPVKNRAWNLLGQARETLERAGAGRALPEPRRREAEEHLMRAEGADWFWWLGEPFHGAEDEVFEELFRAHLVAAYEALGEAPPADLSRPIETAGVVAPIRQPQAFIQPRIDGTRTSYFEWRDAGFYRVPASRGPGSGEPLLSGLYWGFDPGRLYLRLDPAKSQSGGGSPLGPDIEVLIELTAPDWHFTGRLLPEQEPRVMLGRHEPNGAIEELGSLHEVACRDVIELSMPLGRLGIRPGTRLGLSVHFERAGTEVAKVPQKGVIEVEVPDLTFEPDTSAP